MMCFYFFAIISTLRRVWTFNWKKKLKSSSPKDALCQVRLKLAQWFWRRFSKVFIKSTSPKDALCQVSGEVDFFLKVSLNRWKHRMKSQLSVDWMAGTFQWPFSQLIFWKIKLRQTRLEPGSTSQREVWRIFRNYDEYLVFV